MKISFDQSSKVMSAQQHSDRSVLQMTLSSLSLPHNVITTGAKVIVTAGGPCSPGSRNTLDGQSVNIDKLGPGGKANIS